MRFSAGTPGESRKDKRTTSEIQHERKLGANSGRWVKALYPDGALDAIKSKIGEARKYHETVTLPFGGAGDEGSEDGGSVIKGVGILPAALFMEYGEKMGWFKRQIDHLVESTFLATPHKWIDWAVAEHNGTFDPANYPGCTRAADGVVDLDIVEFKEQMRKRFYFRFQTLPVPHADHFAAAVSSLLGTDVESVNGLVADAEKEARRALMRRLIEPVRKMAEKLVEVPKVSAKTGLPKEDIVFRNTLIDNVKEIAHLGTALNITDDPEIAAMVAAVKELTVYDGDALREDKSLRSEAATKAAELFKRLDGYKI
jgi:hypothetical protein